MGLPASRVGFTVGFGVGKSEPTLFIKFERKLKISFKSRQICQHIFSLCALVPDGFGVGSEVGLGVGADEGFTLGQGEGWRVGVGVQIKITTGCVTIGYVCDK